MTNLARIKDGDEEDGAMAERRDDQGEDDDHSRSE